MSSLAPQNPLSYMGVKPPNPPDVIVLSRAPTTLDYQFELGAMWVDPSGPQVYFLAFLAGQNATWLPLGGGTSDVQTLTGDVGGIIFPLGGNIDLLGGILLNTAGTPNTITVNADDNVVGTVNADTGSATPTANAFTIAGGIGCSTSGAGDTITINASGGGLDWNEITVVGPTAMAVNNGYVANNGALVTLTLPASAAFGDILRVAGKGAGGWLIAQNAGQTIHFGTSDTTPGAGGSLASTQQYDAVELLCITANTDFVTLSSIGNITVT